MIQHYIKFSVKFFRVEIFLLIVVHLPRLVSVTLVVGKLESIIKDYTGPIKMNCDGKGTIPTSGPNPSPGPTAGPTPRPTPRPSCTDSNQYCSSWARIGECQKNPSYMNESCRKSCNQCNGGGGYNCNDKSQHCDYWARTGECSRNPAYMKPNCTKSCNFC